MAAIPAFAAELTSGKRKYPSVYLDNLASADVAAMTATAAPLAEVLKLNGYSTAQVGKCHEVPVYETSPMGPFDAWPTGGGGFEYFYGFIGGETNQWHPAIYEMRCERRSSSGRRRSA